MRKSLLFARLDFITIKPYMTIKNFFILTLVSVIMGISTHNVGSITGIIMVYGTIFASYPFAVGDRNGIDTLYATLTLNRKNIVMGRYIFVLLLNIIIAFFALMCSFCVMSVLKKGFDIQGTLITIMACFLIFTSIQSLQLPIYFKLGYTKAKFLAYIPLIVLSLAVSLITPMIINGGFNVDFAILIDLVSINLKTILVAALLLWAFIFPLSFKLSCHFYKKREF